MQSLPSEVYDRKFLRIPLQDKVVDSNEEWSRCGKWILLNQTEDLSWVDDVWNRLQILLEMGCLLMIKASTAAMRNEPGVVLCYTRPGEDKIVQTATEIRKLVHYEACMYYKSNEKTENKVFIRNGDGYDYIHTFKEFLYRYNPEQGWVLVGDFDVENQRKKSFPVVMDLKYEIDIDFDQLPVNSRGTFPMKPEGKNEILMSGKMSGSLRELKHGLTEADRLWIAGTKLVNDGAIHKLRFTKILNRVEFELFFLEILDAKSLVNLCHRIYQMSQVFSFIWFTTDKEYESLRKKEMYEYRYSPEKELYKENRYVLLN